MVGVSGYFSRSKWLLDNTSTTFEPAEDLYASFPLFLLEKITFETRSRGVDVLFLGGTKVVEITDLGV